MADEEDLTPFHRPALHSSGSMATIESSDVDCGMNIDTIGEDLACRAVAVSMISSADPEQGQATGTQPAEPEQAKDFDNELIGQTRSALVQASLDGHFLSALQEGQDPDSMQIQAEAGRQKARDDLVAAAKDGTLDKGLREHFDLRTTEEFGAAAAGEPVAAASEEAAAAEGGDAKPKVLSKRNFSVSFAATPEEARKLAREARQLAKHVLRSTYNVASRDITVAGGTPVSDAVALEAPIEAAVEEMKAQEVPAQELPQEVLPEKNGGPVTDVASTRERTRLGLLQAGADGSLREALTKNKQQRGAAAGEAKPDEKPVEKPVEKPLEKWVPPAEKPCLYYFPFAGRAELTRLIAAIGGLEIDEKAELEDCAPFGSTGSLPCFQHGPLMLSQSFAIEMYVASITPLFANLTPAQRAIDNMFCRIKEDAYKGLSDLMMGLTTDIMSNEREMAIILANIGKVGDEWFTLVEEKLPVEGFVQGLRFPTVADLAVLNMQKAFMPFGAMCTIGGYDTSAKFPKFAAHVARIAEYPPVKVYLESSTTMYADPFFLDSIRLLPAAVAEGSPAEMPVDKPADLEVQGSVEPELEDGYTRHPGWCQSATEVGRAQQSWAADVLDSLAKETPGLGKRKRKPGVRRLSTSSILRSLGCLPSLTGSKSSPSIGANSIIAQQSSNSIRSQLTSPAESDWMVRQTWTPPSPPAPSSSRTAGTAGPATDRSLQQVPSLPNVPATGLRRDPCSSASSTKATAANIARSGVPGLDMTRVHMGADDDDDTDLENSKGFPGQVYSMQCSDGLPSGASEKYNVPTLDMSALQAETAGSSPSKNSRSGGSRQVAPRDQNGQGAGNDLIRPASRGVGEPIDQVKPGSRGSAPGALAAAALRPVIPGPREVMQAGGPAYPLAYPGGNDMAARADFQYGFSLDVAGSVVAGTEKKVSLNAPVGVRLPPVSKGPKGYNPAPVSHVHMHHHLHYHVNRSAGESDLSVGPP